MGEKEDERSAQAGQLFENFVQASTCKGTLQAFSILCRQMDLDPLDYRNFYSNLKATVTNWKAKALWTKLDKRAGHKEYKKAKACEGTRSLIIGGGPCGLRTAIELALLGAKVVVIEKRDTFSRNNVLHLWPYTIHDLRGLGAKKFYGKFCAGAIDHISIRQLQLMLLKVSLIVGVEVHVNVEFVKLLEPLDNQENEGLGWRAEIRPSNHPLTDYEFDVVIGADGRRNTLDGFKRKEFRGKLAIAITANFVNRNTTAEAKVEEISGVAFIFNQKFFLELKEETGIDLENIVYYRDNTHYFVMTAKKQSLLDKGVIIHDYIETEKLLGQDNVNQEALLSYAREAADFGTNYQLPSLDYAINHCNQPDVAMFDFTCMCASENAALFREKCGHQLLVALVGDSLLEPFWPTGTGCARGFLAAFDTVWMVRGWAQGKTHLEILAEREGLYRLLPQTTTENISKNFDQYTIDPVTRYPNLNSSCVKPHQVRHLFIDGQQDSCPLERGGSTRSSVNLSRRESDIRPSRLLTWCQKQTQGYRGVDVTNLTSSWKSGLALCALIHRLRPDLIDFDSLNEKDSAKNNQLAFDIAEHEFGIQPVTTGNEMALDQDPDKLMMVLYISKLYEMFRNSPASITGTRETDENNEATSSESAHSVYNLMNRTQPKKRIPKDNGKLQANDPMNKRRRKGSTYLEELSCQSAPPAGDGGEQNKVRSMATQLLAKFEENASPGSSLRNKCDGSAASSRLIQTSIECPVSYQAEPFKPDMSAEQCNGSAGSSIQKPIIRFESYEAGPLKSTEQCNGSAAPSVMIKKTIDQSERCPAEPSMPAKQRTVGRVSSHIGARAETLAILYETDHRPNALPCIVRKEFPQNLGGSDMCHFCSKRVYVMERLSAEGHFFHRECFRCDVCSSTLRLGGHAYDSQHGKFYCKPHYSQRRSSLQSSSKFLRRTEDQGRLTSSPDRSDPYSATDSLQSQPSGHRYRYTGLLNGLYTRMVPEVAEEEAVDLDMPDSNRTADAEKQDNSNTSLRPQDSAQEKKEPSGSNSSLLSGNSRWKRKIRATLPLILVRHFSHENATEKEEPIIEEANFDFNVIEPPQVSHDGPKLPPDSPNQNPSMGKEAPPVTKVPQLEEAVGPKKRLTLSLSEKQKLLDWNLVTPEEAQSPGGGDPSKHSKPGDQILPLPQVEAEPVPAQAQPAPSMFQIWANAFRRSFGVPGTSTDSNTVVTRRNNNGPTKPRPLSDGAFSFSSLFGATAQSQEAEPVGVGQKSQPTPHPCKASMGDRPADLPMLLDQVSLGSNKSVGSFTTDDMASLPPRKLNFFSYLRLKKREGPESVGAGVLEKDIRTILSNIRNKASSEQQKDESNSSSDDELVIAKPLSQPKTHGSSERQRRRQEETVIQQDKREQLKRLHRAQVIQRQLEEVGEKQKDLEERGVTIEKVLRAESPDKGDGLSDEHELLQMWFKLVLEKNRLARYEEELVIFAQELELEDRQSQLQRDLRCRMSIDDSRKSPSELAEEQEMLTEIMKVVERRDTLVSLLEEQRLQERAEDRDPESLVLSRGYQFHWT
ncbi:protein-methionine sulfoxide oxidase mical2b isoform X6 [Oncorhynchus tshawytscha]|uniref:protein-methionine sulfoxide oxidase mical2b isoform X6 n=1 Tax=Oncorhynchus tshawytscha TaxID=74940 RepID=UPI000D0A7446|nr:protein-methionine sulfoxide oxidase mical2b isoform X6 [Oncorhynchus tshawytscha]